MSRLFHVSIMLVLGVSILGTTSVSAAPQPPRAPDASGHWAVYPTPGLTPHSPLFGVATAAVDDAWAVGSEGGVYHFNGSAWSEVTSTVTLTLESVAPIPGTPDTAVVVGMNEGGGANPSLVLNCTPASCIRDTTAPNLGRLDSVWALSASDYWAVGGGNAQGTILHHTGTTWSTNLVTGSVPNVHYHNIQMLSTTDGWAVGESATSGGPGTIIHYNGTTWQAVNTGLSFSGPLQGLSFLSSAEGWVVGGTLGHPVILHYQQGAVPSWTSETITNPPGQTLLWYVDMKSDHGGYASGNDGLILYHFPYATTWEVAFQDPSSAPIYGVWVTRDGTTGWAVGGTEMGPAVVDQMTGGVLVTPTPKMWLPIIRK